MKSANVLRILAQVLESGGATVNAETEQCVFPAAGYAVSCEDGAIVPVKGNDVQGIVTPEVLAAIERQHAKHNPFVGLWLDDGKLYVDSVLIIRSRDGALIFAAEQKQLSIYGFAEKEVIWVNAVTAA